MLTNRFFSLSSSLTLAAAMSLGSITTRPVSAGDTAVPEVTAGPTAVASGPTVRQRQWLNATPEQRIQLAEQVGEDGARALARSKDWKALMDGTNSMLRQGFDQVYQSADRIVHVVEAKGGGSQVGNAYGYTQGSAEWAVKAAERTLKSSIASATEKTAAKAVLEAARSAKLEVHVVRTRHVLGEPTVAVLEETIQASDGTAKLADTVIEDLARQGIPVLDQASAAGRGLPRTVGNAATTDGAALSRTLVADAAQAAPATSEAVGTAVKITRGVSKAALPVAVVVDTGLRVNRGVQIEHQFAIGEFTQQQREVAHAKNVAGMAGGWGGAWAGAELGAMGGGAAGSCVAPGPGTAIGAGAGAIVGGITGYVGGEAAAEAGAEWAVKKVHQAGTTVADTASGAWNLTAQAARETTTVSSDVAKATWHGTKRAANATGEACSQGWSWTASKAGAAWNRVTGN